MKPCIPTSFYHDPQIFSLEQSVFENVWQFVGFTKDLQNNNDYICRQVGRSSVLVQNFDGQIKAFQNVCSHRFNRIHQSCAGNGPLRCQYHGWTYDRDGRPFSIPQKPRFKDLDRSEIEVLRLDRWSVDSCGPFIFVKRQADDLSLRDYLQGSYKTLEAMGYALGKPIDCNEMIIKANWKILVENTLESYHVSSIHPTTFNVLGASGLEFTFEGPHSAWSAALNQKMNDKWHKMDRLLDSRPLKFDGYFHQLIFPNLTLASTYGISFSIQHFETISPSETRFTSYVFETETDSASQNTRSILELLGSSIIEFNRAVFNEDKAICEQVQLGVSETSKSGILSDEEGRVFDFQRSYMNIMNVNQG